MTRDGLIGLAMVIGLAVAWALASRRAGALEELARGLGDLGRGRFVRPVQARVGGALGRLAARFNEVAPRLEERLGRLEGDRQLMGAVLAGMTEGVIAVDPRRRLLFANEAAGRLFGIGPEAVGRLIAELIRSPEVQEAVAATLHGSGPHRAEVHIPGLEGWPLGPGRVLEVHGTRLSGSKASGAVLVFHEITELRRLERMRQDFVANASHELKTPLAAIKAYAETLLDGALHDEEVNARFLQQIDEQADRLNLLVLDLLSLARLESGQEVYRHAPIALAPIVRDCAEAHRGRAAARGLALAIELEGLPEDVRIEADEEEIRQVLDNLIDNAIKYTPGGGRVAVVGRSEGPGVVLEVADSGIGIARDEQPRIFERFYRVDQARSRALGGTGLGLAIVKHLVQGLGGQVGVDSRLGAGSTFRVHLPRVLP